MELGFHRVLISNTMWKVALGIFTLNWNNSSLYQCIILDQELVFPIQKSSEKSVKKKKQKTTPQQLGRKIKEYEKTVHKKNKNIQT